MITIAIVKTLDTVRLSGLIGKLLNLTKKTFTLHKTQRVKAHAEHLVNGDRKCSAMKIQLALTSNCIRHIFN